MVGSESMLRSNPKRGSRRGVGRETLMGDVLGDFSFLASLAFLCSLCPSSGGSAISKVGLRTRAQIYQG